MFDNLREYLDKVTTPVLSGLYTEAFVVCEQYIGPELEDRIDSLLSTAADFNNQIAFDFIREYVLRITTESLFSMGIHLDEESITHENIPMFVKMLDAMSTVAYYDDPNAIILILDDADTPESAVVNLVAQMTGDDPFYYESLIDDINPDLIDNLRTLTIKQREELLETYTDTNPIPDFVVDRVKALYQGVSIDDAGVVINYIRNGGNIGLDLDDYLVILKPQLITLSADQLSKELVAVASITGCDNSNWKMEANKAMNILDIPVDQLKALSVKMGSIIDEVLA